MRPIFSGARRAFAAAVLVSTIASLPGVVAQAAVNNPPVADSPTLYVGPSGVLSVATSTLASDPDGDSLTFNAGTATNGTLALNGSQFQYTLTAGFTTGAFNYGVFDGNAGGSATGTVTVEQDLVPPSFYDLPYDLVLLTGPDDTLSLPDLTDSVCPSDNIGVASVTQSPVPGTVLTPGSHEIAFTVTDLAGNTTTETVWIEVVTSVTVAQAAGDSVEGEPEGTKVIRFGVPSINQYGDTAYLGRLTAPGVRSTLAVLAGNPVSVRTRVGDEAVGIPGAAFSFFLDPVLDDEGNVAFIARVTGQGVVPENDRGVWVHNGQTLQLVAREGGEAPGAPGAQFERFTSISLKNGQVLFLAELVQGVGGIDKTNDIGVWSWDPENGLLPFIREGNTVETSSGAKQVTVFSMLRAAGTSRGHGRSHSDFGMHALWARFEDGSKGIVTAFPSELSEPGAPFELFSIAETRTVLPSDSESAPTFVPKAMGLPATNSLFGFASVMTLASDTTAGVNLANNQAIFISSLFSSGWYPVARKGDVITEGVSWRGFKDPILNNNYDVAWVGRLAGAGVDLSNDYAIAYARGFAEGNVEVIAREGGEVPGVAGAKWSQFLSIALPDGENWFFPGEGEGEGEGPFDVLPANGPIFLARIASTDSSEGAAITSANDVGVWAVDGNGELRLLLREGDTVNVNGVEKQVKSMTLLNSVSGSRDVSRSFNERGEVIVRAQLTDHSQAVLTLRMPVQAGDPRD